MESSGDSTERSSGVFDRYDTRHADLSPPARVVALILDSLAKTSRAFKFYAPNNRALQAFIAELNDLFATHFEQHALLTLQIQPDRFLWGDEAEVVYQDADRENGFPFKLYRDGIRVLALRRGLTQAEISTLLDILGTRSFGALQEEDLATLLWRARLEHVEYRQVRGFVAADRVAVDGGRGGGPDGGPGERGDGDPMAALAVGELGSLALNDDQRAQIAHASNQLQGAWLDEWTPSPAASVDPTPPSFSPIDDRTRGLFWGRTATDPAAILAQLAVRAIDVGGTGLPAVPTPDELIVVLEEARASMLEAGEVDHYWKVLQLLVDRVSALPPQDPWRTAIETFLMDGGGRNTVRLLLGALGRGLASAALVDRVIRTMRGLQLQWLTDALGEAPTEEGRVAVCEVLVQLVWPDADRTTQLVEACPDAAVRALVAVLARVGRHDALPYLLALFPRADEQTQATIVQVAMLRPDAETLASLAAQALASPSEAVRLMGLQAAARSGDRRLAHSVRQMIEPATLSTLSRETAVEALRTFVVMSGPERVDWLAEQARPPRLALRDARTEELRCRYALALGAVATPKAEQALLSLRSKGTDAFREAVAAALDRIARGRDR